ncbi:MAG: hypothetical protein FJ279_35405, partial [Planctomycetes bacterium]|nr:hypothetical protein [Planctomycetota bacterium]
MTLERFQGKILPMINRLCLAALVAAFVSGCASVGRQPKDLNPVTFKRAPSHAAVTLVKDGQPKATIAVMGGRMAGVAELQRSIKEATGAELRIVKDKIEPPAIVIGDCDLAKKHGLEAARMPVEGFAIKTAADLVFIVGNERGTEWGIYEFLERF